LIEPNRIAEFRVAVSAAGDPQKKRVFLRVFEEENWSEDLMRD
jgi:hypothetical protein